MKIFPERCRGRSRRTARIPAALAVAALAAAVALAGCAQQQAGSHESMGALAANPAVDPGSPLGGRPAPDFRLQDQFGRTVSLSQFRGRAILLAFADSRCSTICPLITTSMLQAVRLMEPRAGACSCWGSTPTRTLPAWPTYATTPPRTA
jgi:cytochrome oxidase Cu insertion factor (SCO1/SenC/PrrC family)